MRKPNLSKYPGLAPSPPVVEPDPMLYERIGLRIAEAREAKRLKQDELGEQIGESAITISRWETAARKPNVEDVYKLACALDRDILYFVEETPSYDESIRQLNRTVEDLPQEDREELLAIAKLKLERKKRDYLARKMSTEV